MQAAYIARVRFTFAVPIPQNKESVITLMAFFSKGIVLAQHKEPAFSRPLVRFVNPQPAPLLPPHPVTDTADLTAEDLIEIARAAHIVDERDGRLLYRKLNRAKNRAAAVIADAVDDEPYVSSKITPLLKLREDVLGGLQLCCRVAGTNAIHIMAYKNITDLETRIPSYLNGYKISRLRGGYPARPQAFLRHLPRGQQLTVGVGALIHLYRAVTLRRRQSTVFLTVAGNCVANSMNMEVSIGMTLQQVLERCGLTDEPTRVISGGSMTGIAVVDTDRNLVSHTTRAILAFRENLKEYNYSCINCGRCERVCPRGLSPMYIQRFVENSYYLYLRDFEPQRCSGCGTCSYMCPSRLNVSRSVQTAKEYALAHFGEIPDLEVDDLDV